MDIKELEMRSERDFNNTICLIGVIPFLVFVHVLAGKFGFKIFIGETGYVVLVSMILLLLGIIMGKKMLWRVIRRLIDFNQQVIGLQKDLLEKKRLAAITEITLTLGHEINNPLAVISGNLEFIENSFAKNNIPSPIQDRFITIKNHCERIREAINKLAHLSKPAMRTVYGDTKIIDLGKSKTDLSEKK